MYSWMNGSVLLNAVNAKGFDANLMKKSLLGSMSMRDSAPPEGKICRGVGRYWYEHERIQLKLRG